MPGSVTVRMYRNILGDCFVLTHQDGAKRRIAVIDCGVLQNVLEGDRLVEKLPAPVVAAVGRDALKAVKGGNDTIKAVARSVIDHVKNGKDTGTIDVLVATHEHFDHLSGFALARDLWNDPKLTVSKLWLAWTEKPGEDPALQQLRADMAAARRAVRRTALAGQYLGVGADSDEMAAVQALADFIGPLDDDPLAAAGGGVPGTAATLAMLKAKVGDANIHYWEPGDVIPAEEGIGLKAYVMGPPHDLTLLKKDSPSAGSASEVYLVDTGDAAAAPRQRPIYLSTASDASVVEAAALRALQRAPLDASAFSAAEPEVELVAAAEPFAPTRRQPYVFDSAHRGAELKGESDARRAIRALYEDEANDQLRIEEEWLSAAESLALKLDSDTNNTSLVLAFELPGDDRRILLFPGDAQVGNWLSWGEQTYPRAEDGTGPVQKAADILSRTVFYKVGHHGSHNATAREKGLELMVDPRLVAAIPVVETVAKVQGKGRKEPGKGWEMPYAEMYTRLKEKTRGRIVRGDGDPAAEAEVFLREADADHPVKVAHDPNGLWVELTFPVS